MKRVAVFLGTSLMLGCQFAMAKTIEFTVPIEPQQAVPLPDPQSTASGIATFNLHLPDNPGDETWLEYLFEFSGLDLGNMVGFPTNPQTPGNPNDDVTAIHIHNAPPGAIGEMFLGIVNPRHDFDDVMVDILGSTISGRWEDSDVDPPSNAPKGITESLDELFAGQLYLNVHTVGNPSSDIRAQIVVGAPEPSALVLGGIGVLLLWWHVAARRRSDRIT